MCNIIRTNIGYMFELKITSKVINTLFILSFTLVEILYFTTINYINLNTIIANENAMSFS